MQNSQNSAESCPEMATIIEKFCLPGYGEYLPFLRKQGIEPPMAMDAVMIENLIQQGIPDATVRISDLRGDGEHYAAHIVAEAFRGKSRVQQHQMVYAALQGRMGSELHALAIQTSVPE